MRLREVILFWYRSVDYLKFEVKPFTVLYGPNNSGKTNVLEGIYGLLSPEELDRERADHALPLGLRGSGAPPLGALLVQLDEGTPFDDDVLTFRRSDSASPDESVLLPAFQAAFIGDYSETWLTFHDPHDYFGPTHDYFDEQENFDRDANRVERAKFVATKVDAGPRPLPIFLDWEIDDIETRVGNALMEHLASLGPFVEVPILFRDLGQEPGAPASWHLNPQIQDYLDRFSGLANMFLPDFLDGSIHANIQVATNWTGRFSVTLSYREPRSVDVELPIARDHDAVGSLGRGSSRWIAAAIQIALHLLVRSDYSDPAESPQEKHFSGNVLLIDEPETHLHPSAVKSVLRWCNRMVDHWGFNVVVATHHEEFLRHSGPDVAHVHITRCGNPLMTHARTLLASATPLLQDAALELGVHPAVALSLQRAILFVEGTLDEAVLDEYAGPAFDAAGVTIIPIHGTKNLEGLIDGEFTTRLGIKTGVLTDKTLTDTIWDRSNSKRSSEEKKLVRLIQRFEEQGLTPPYTFGVPEDDLLFALPEQAIRDQLNGPFPGWHELRDECRAAEGRGPSDSVDWKSYAETHYGLSITTASGVRTIIRALDLAGVELPSIGTVVDEVIAWANDTDGGS